MSLNSCALFFYDNGIGTFPLIDESKEPACRWTTFSASREKVAFFRNYGVRLGVVSRPVPTWIGVIDTDSDPATRLIESLIQGGEIPETPLRVTTGREGGGTHRYYFLDKPVQKFIHRDGLTIEFRNVGQYVVGPGSVHPSGRIYTAAEWSWNVEEIPFFDASTFVFDDGSCGRRSEPGRRNAEGYVFPNEVSAGERHDALFRAIRSLKGLGAERADVRWFVSQANEGRCKPPLVEDEKFEQWFARAWDLTDRPLVKLSAPLSVNWRVF